MQIEKLTTKNNEDIALGKFTVLIGPNNVGKSQILKDIHNKLTQGEKFKAKLIDEIVCKEPKGFSELLNGLEIKADPNIDGRSRISGIKSNLKSSEHIDIYLEKVKKQVSKNGISSTFGSIAKYRVSYLESESRLSVAKTSPSLNIHKNTPQNLMQALYAADSEMEDTLRKVFQETFEMDIKIDYSGLTELCFRIGKEFIDVPSGAKEALQYFGEYPVLDTQGDGFRSFVGVVLSLLLSEGRIVLLDEPEAFLHPAQARKLGLWIANHAHSVPGQVIISTHNSNFISGVISANKPVDIFRLNRMENITEFTKISPESTKALAQSPVLSSQRVLESLFYRGVAVCEADSDRIVYSTVANNEHDSQEVLFIHAHNKQTVHKVIQLLRSANIPCGAVVDFDILNDKDDLKKLGDSLGMVIDESEYSIIEKINNHIESLDDGEALSKLKDDIGVFLEQLSNNEHTFSGARGAVNRIRKDFSKWRDVKSEGIKALPEDLLKNVKPLISLLRNKRIFVTPVGELEGWINLGVKKKNKWIVLALEYLKDNPAPEELSSFVGNIIHDLSDAKI